MLINLSLLKGLGGLRIDKDNPGEVVSCPPRPDRSRSRESIPKIKCSMCGGLNLPNDFQYTPCGAIVCIDFLSNCRVDHLDMCSFCVPDVDHHYVTNANLISTECDESFLERDVKVPHP